MQSPKSLKPSGNLVRRDLLILRPICRAKGAVHSAYAGVLEIGRLRLGWPTFSTPRRWREEVLQQAGYATAHIGKWHLGGGRDVRDAPRFAAYGYDRGLGTWESPEPAPEITAKDWIWSDDDKVKRWDRTRWMVDQTLAFLESNRARPCFVNLWLDDTHTPWVPSAEDQAKKQPESRPMLKKVIEEMDGQLGRLFETLRNTKSDRPTLVVFLGDNGPLPPTARSTRWSAREHFQGLTRRGFGVPGWPGAWPGSAQSD